ncbi:hypothetical protein TNCT_173411 [Trichonephila clavata]|uniref:Uncharacterized protein n=1 Tax=Trichonephila clavata TaxID=2740835 RepID=A0A8X6FQ81_TRICU|nr:hypothetical protein TNCT_173411 [Trichonephila clavata]
MNNTLADIAVVFNRRNSEPIVIEHFCETMSRTPEHCWSFVTWMSFILSFTVWFVGLSLFLMTSQCSKNVYKLSSSDNAELVDADYGLCSRL